MNFHFRCQHPEMELLVEITISYNKKIYISCSDNNLLANQHFDFQLVFLLTFYIICLDFVEQK